MDEARLPHPRNRHSLTRRDFARGALGASGLLLLNACAPAPAAPAKPSEPAKPAAPAATSAPAAAAKPTEAPKPALAPPTTAPPATAVPKSAAETMLKAPEPNPKRGGTLRYVAGIGLQHYDLHQGASNTVIPAVYDNLVAWDVLDGLNSIRPSLATGWELSPDGKEYTFKLRQNVKFHDGTPFTADDVVATFSRVFNPPQGVISAYKELYGPVTGVTKVDNFTVKFTLSAPYYTFLQAMAAPGVGPIYPKKALDENNQDMKKVMAPGTGPFTFKEYKAGESISLVKNPNYWNPELPYVDGILAINAGTADDRGTAVLTDRADYAHHAGNSTWEEGSKRKDIVSVGVGLQCTLVGLYMNNKKKPFDDPRVRRAVTLARPAQDMVSLYARYERPMFGRWVPYGDPFAMPDAEIKKLPGWRDDKAADLEEAKRLMADAGLGGGIQGVDMIAWGSHVTYNVAVAFQDWMKRLLNIEVKLRPIEQAQILQETQAGTYDCAIFFYGIPGAILDFSPIANSLFKTGGGQNVTGYSNPEFDKLLAQIDVEQDKAKRTTMIRQAEDMLDANPPVVPIGWAQAGPMWRNTTKGANFEKRRVNLNGSQLETAWLDK